MTAELKLLDTSVWISILRPRGSPDATRQVREWLNNREVVTTPPILAEILQGAMSDKEYRNLAHDFSELHQLPCTDHVWERWYATAYKLNRNGMTVPLIDVLIAAIAMEHDCLLVHRDKDFDRIKLLTSLKALRLN